MRRHWIVLAYILICAPANTCAFTMAPSSSRINKRKAAALSETKDHHHQAMPPPPPAPLRRSARFSLTRREDASLLEEEDSIQLPAAAGIMDSLPGSASLDSDDDDDDDDSSKSPSPSHNNVVRGKLRRTRSVSNRATMPFRSSSNSKAAAATLAANRQDHYSLSNGLEHHHHHRSSTASFSSTGVVIRAMRMADMTTVYELGNAIFTAGEFPNMYRTWDAFNVVESLEGSPEFCFVAEHVNEDDARLVETMAMTSTTTNEHGTIELSAATTTNDGVTTTTTTTIIIGFLLGESMTKSSVGTRGYIQWVAVLPEHRRHGVATWLLQSFMQAAQSNNISYLLADTPADNWPARHMFAKVGISHAMDHVYLTRQMPKKRKETDNNNTTAPPLPQIEDDGSVDYTYTVTSRGGGGGGLDDDATKHRVTIRGMEIEDLYPVYCLGERIFTAKSPNLFHFWDQHLVLGSYLSDPDLSLVATVRDNVVGFLFGTTIVKPRSSWKYGYLVWLGTAPELQGLGVASQLLATLVELFRTEKVRMLMIDTQSNNDAALAFFRAKGFGHDEEHVYLANVPPGMTTTTTTTGGVATAATVRTNGSSGPQ